MRQFVALVVLGSALVALPSTAAARTDCSYTREDGASPVATVYTQNTPDGSGTSRQADVAAGVCTDHPYGSLPVTNYHGGLVEVGAGVDGSGPGGVYAIWDGDDENTTGVGFSAGYAGISNFETGYKSECPFGSSGSGTNSGGCVGYVNLIYVPVPLIACGYTTGPSWEQSGRDGCIQPETYCCPWRSSRVARAAKGKER